MCLLSIENLLLRSHNYVCLLQTDKSSHIQCLLVRLCVCLFHADWQSSCSCCTGHAVQYIKYINESISLILTGLVYAAQCNVYWKRLVLVLFLEQNSTFCRSTSLPAHSATVRYHFVHNGRCQMAGTCPAQHAWRRSHARQHFQLTSLASACEPHLRHRSPAQTRFLTSPIDTIRITFSCLSFLNPHINYEFY